MVVIDWLQRHINGIPSGLHLHLVCWQFVETASVTEHLRSCPGDTDLSTPC